MLWIVLQVFILASPAQDAKPKLAPAPKSPATQPTKPKTSPPPKTSTTPTSTIIQSIADNMVYIPGGTFWMGCSHGDTECETDESPRHQITLSSYYIGKYEVTQAQWEAVMGTTVREQRNKVSPSWPLLGEGPNYPMYYVSWNEVQEFIKKLNQMTGKSFRLPTEAEWEYAARGGNKSQGYKYAGSNNIEDVAWYYKNSGSKTHPVGQKQPNELGLYDISGNVNEWCADFYGYYNFAAKTNPRGPTSGIHMLTRGGCYDDSAQKCRVSSRSRSPGLSIANNGFRLALSY